MSQETQDVPRYFRSRSRGLALCAYRSGLGLLVGRRVSVTTCIQCHLGLVVECCILSGTALEDERVCKCLEKHVVRNKQVTLEMSSWAARSLSFRAAICWSFVGFLYGRRRTLEPCERPAEESCDLVISGTPGCAVLFLLRVFIKRVAESARDK